MPTFDLEIVEIITHTFQVEADTEDEAQSLATKAYTDNDLESMEEYFQDIELHDITVLGIDN